MALVDGSIYLGTIEGGVWGVDGEFSFVHLEFWWHEAEYLGLVFGEGLGLRWRFESHLDIRTSWNEGSEGYNPEKDWALGKQEVKKTKKTNNPPPPNKLVSYSHCILNHRTSFSTLIKNQLSPKDSVSAALSLSLCSLSPWSRMSRVPEYSPRSPLLLSSLLDYLLELLIVVTFWP